MKLEKAIKLRKEGKLKESNEILIKLVEKFPEDPIINYQCAWSFDVLEKEVEAIGYYEKAINLGLPDKDLKEAYLGLGSTYRTIGEYEKSREIFEDAIAKFDDDSLKVFYAMTLYNLKEHSKSMELLLKIIAAKTNDSNINTYSKAIKFYSDKLDNLFK